MTAGDAVTRDDLARMFDPREPGPRAPFTRWRSTWDGRESSEPRCCGGVERRGPFGRHPAECSRRGVVFDGVRYGWERWYCVQHAPATHDAKLVAEQAPWLLDLVAEALELVPQKGQRAADWRRRAERVLQRAKGGRS